MQEWVEFGKNFIVEMYVLEEQGGERKWVKKLAPIFFPKVNLGWEGDFFFFLNFFDFFMIFYFFNF